MRIKVLDVKIKERIVVEMIGYTKGKEPTVQKALKIRPDIDPTQLRELRQGLLLEITYKLHKMTFTKRLQYYPGFVFDTASVPSLGKAIIDNDGANMYVPSLYHDAGYGLKFDSREFTDALFRALVNYFGKKYKVRFRRVKALIAWAGPASRFGKKIYESSEPSKHFNYGYCVEM